MYLKLGLASLIVGLVALNFDYILVYVTNGTTPKTEIFTENALKEYNGIIKPDLYLSIMGKVFNVTKGWDHYGPGKSYNFFIGKDASRSFITGEFDAASASDKVADLSAEELRSLNHWVKFYSRDYQRMGKLLGTYYNEKGKLTPYGREVKKLLKKAEKAKDEEALEKLQFPPCNVEWEPSMGTRVWCTSKSGGIEREWVGVPRQFYEPGKKTYRCACINPQMGSIAKLKQYEGCDSDSTSCYIKE